MQKLKFILNCALICTITYTCTSTKTTVQPKPKIAFTFDDGSTNDMPNYPSETWNGMMLSSLEKHHLKAILFAACTGLQGEKGKQILQSWDKAGHKIANHTYSHKNFGNPKTDIEWYKQDFLRNDSIINQYAHFFPYFRFPYLKEGDTPEKVQNFRAFLKEKGYSNGHVSIDASDWYVSGRLVDRLKSDPKADISGFRDFYVAHLYDRACYYDALAVSLTGRQINHVILLHHNLSSALFLDDLIQHFKQKGWEVMDADKAYKDPIYQSITNNIPAGESFIWALAKQSGKYESVLRYPAEDGDYEQAKMDQLGL